MQTDVLKSIGEIHIWTFGKITEIWLSKV